VYPYQIGQDNEEALASGAFWFYRKLGFRPVRKELERLAEREEKKIAVQPGYRTPPRILRRLAEGHVVYELPEAERGAWDRFRIRHIGIAVQKLMAREYGGDSERMKKAAQAKLSRVLGVNPARWPGAEQRAFEDFSLILTLVPDLRRWQSVEKSGLVAAIRAKASLSDDRYAALLAKQTRLRRALLRLGSRVPR
jgi:hypothetical protein